MKTIHAGLIAALGAILFLSGCAWEEGGGSKPKTVRISLPKATDHPVTLQIIVGEYPSVRSAEVKRTTINRTLTLVDKQVITFPIPEVTIPAGKRYVDIPVSIAHGVAPGREFVVIAIEKQGRKVTAGGAPMVGVTALRIGNNGQLATKSTIHIGPGPRPK